MDIALWIIASLTALAFLFAGATKLIRPRAALQDVMPFTRDFAGWHVKAIGAAEVVGAVGLVLPEATGVAPVLTSVAGPTRALSEG